MAKVLLHWYMVAVATICTIFVTMMLTELYGTFNTLNRELTLWIVFLIIIVGIIFYIGSYLVGKEEIDFLIRQHGRS